VVVTLTGCHLLLPFSGNAGDVGRGEGAGRDARAVVDGRAADAPRVAHDVKRLLEVKGPTDGGNPCVGDGGPLPAGTDCLFQSVFQGECDGAGLCLECLPLGNQCGPGSSTPCCDDKVCMGSPQPGFDTCGGV